MRFDIDWSFFYWFSMWLVPCPKIAFPATTPRLLASWQRILPKWMYPLGTSVICISLSSSTKLSGTEHGEVQSRCHCFFVILLLMFLGYFTCFGLSPWELELTLGECLNLLKDDPCLAKPTNCPLTFYFSPKLRLFSSWSSVWRERLEAVIFFWHTWQWICIYLGTLFRGA